MNHPLAEICLKLFGLGSAAAVWAIAYFFYWQGRLARSKLKMRVEGRYQ